MRLLSVIILIFIGVRKSYQLSDSNDLSSANQNQWKLIAILLISGVLMLLLAMAFLLWKLFQLNKEQESNNRSAPIEMGHNEVRTPTSTDHGNSRDREELITITNNIDADRKYRIEMKNLGNLEIIENGSFNIIQKGQLKMAKPQNIIDRCKRISVTVKGAQNQQDSIQQRMILDELKVLCDIGEHPNIMSLVGFVSNPNQVLIISEYAEGGNLSNFLQKCKFKNLLVSSESGDNMQVTPQSIERKVYKNEQIEINDSLNSICTFDLLSFAYQIANGMKYFTGFSYVHRNLALRSIFITSNKTIRIGDFGLARKHGNNEYYRVNSNSIPLPKLWRAPETFIDQRFTEKSDVWSFAVCLYELFTLGAPFEDVEDVLDFLERNLPEPEYCHGEIFQFMRKCWNLDPDNRPSFANCVEFFENHMDKFGIQIRRQIDSKLRSASECQKELAKWR